MSGWIAGLLSLLSKSLLGQLQLTSYCLDPVCYLIPMVGKVPQYKIEVVAEVGILCTLEANYPQVPQVSKQVWEPVSQLGKMHLVGKD